MGLEVKPADVAQDLYGLTTKELLLVRAIVKRLKYGTWRKDAARRVQLMRMAAIEASLSHLLEMLNDEVAGE